MTGTIERVQGYDSRSDHSRGYRQESRQARIARKNAEQRRRRTVVFSAVISPLIVCLMLVFSLSIQSKAGSDHEVYKYYTSVEVASGDTLWTIADQYMGEGSFDKRAYIDEVKSLNHMYGDDINAGEYLVVPYYTAELH